MFDIHFKCFGKLLCERRVAWVRVKVRCVSAKCKKGTTTTKMGSSGREDRIFVRFEMRVKCDAWIAPPETWSLDLQTGVFLGSRSECFGEVFPSRPAQSKLSNWGNSFRVHTRDRVKKTNEEQKYTKQWFKAFVEVAKRDAASGLKRGKRS
jgi:hypothetical protein